MSAQVHSAPDGETNSLPKANDDWLHKTAIVIPTYKAERHWSRLQPSLSEQGISPDRVLIIDSSSPDQTTALARSSGYRVVTIPQSDFNHGGTRQLAHSYLPDAEFLLYITQDVVFASADSVLRLCQSMKDPRVGVAYGRQLPREAADPIERHARLFNYPDASYTRSFEDRHRFGIRTAFLSNSFALYRRSALEAVGGFPANVILGEDVFVATQMLMQGWHIHYAADAQVIHSHPLSLREEFRRYFDTGSHHARERWILEASGRADGEGLKFVKSELRYLARDSKRSIPTSLLRTTSKLVAYRLGLLSPKLPRALNRKLATHPKVWL